MIVESIFHIPKRFKDVKFWVVPTGFTLKCKEIRKHFNQYHPTCDSKSFCLYMPGQALHIISKWHAGTRGGNGILQPKKLGIKPVKRFVLLWKELMTEMKFSNVLKPPKLLCILC